MKKIKPPIVLYYIAIVTTICLFILIIVYIVKYNNKSSIEGFQVLDPGGLGELTTTQLKNYRLLYNKQQTIRADNNSDSDANANQIHHDSNFYEIQKNTNTILTGAEIKSIGATNICIYKDVDAGAGNKMEMECISAGQLGLIRELPKFRREHVCIDEECIGVKDIRVLNGEDPFKLSHNNKVSNLDQCLHMGKVTAHGCTGTPFDLHTLKTNICKDANDFTLHESDPLITEADAKEDADADEYVSDQVQNIDAQSREYIPLHY